MQMHAAKLPSRFRYGTIAAGGSMAELYRIVSTHERITTTTGIDRRDRAARDTLRRRPLHRRLEREPRRVARNPGYLASTLHRALDPNNRLRFVEPTRFTTADATS